MMSEEEIAQRLAEVLGSVAEAARASGREAREVRLVAVSKRIDERRIAAAVAAGQRDFGENYVQEAIGKIDRFGESLRWHMIGSLQSNKAALAGRRFHLIHSLSSMSAARAISRAMTAQGSQCRALIQVHLGGGAQRAGVAPAELESFVRELVKLPGLIVDGLMGVAPLGEEPRPHFAHLRGMLEELRRLELSQAPLRELSAGMSGDYREAIAEGATLVRIGESVFGPRNG